MKMPNKRIAKRIVPDPERYDKWYKKPFGKYADRLEKNLVLLFLGNAKGMKILDVGCGTGNYCLLLAKMGAQMTGIDSSRKMISRAKEKAKRQGIQAKFHIGSAESLPFKPKSFDAVISVAACEFFTDMGKAADEMKRVVKGNGKIVIGLINKWSLYCSGKRLISIFKEDSVYKRAKFYSILGLKKIFGGEVKWGSTLFAQEWFPSWLLQLSCRFEGILSKVLKPFGAFLVLKIKPEKGIK